MENEVIKWKISSVEFLISNILDFGRKLDCINIWRLRCSEMLPFFLCINMICAWPLHKKRMQYFYLDISLNLPKLEYIAIGNLPPAVTPRNSSKSFKWPTKLLINVETFQQNNAKEIKILKFYWKIINHEILFPLKITFIHNFMKLFLR